MYRIHSFLGELNTERISIHFYTYNGISIKQSTIEYKEHVEKLFNDAVSALNYIDDHYIEDVDYQIIETRANQELFLEQPQESLTLLHRITINHGVQALYNSEEEQFYRFVMECIAIQKEFLQKFSSKFSQMKKSKENKQSVKETKSKENKKNVKETESKENKKPDKETDSNGNTSMEALRDKEWLTAKETATRYPSLAYNNIKSRNWRISNKFPYEGYDERKGAHNRVVFNSKDVENWIRNHDIR